MIPNWLEKKVRPDILKMKAYSSARSLVSKNTSEKVFLDANENSFSDSPWARYPSQQPQELVQKLAEVFAVPTENLLVTRGSDEAIDCLIRTFVEAGHDQVLSCPPTYGMYKTSTEIQGGEYLEIPLINFDLDVACLISAVSEKTKIIFLCSPNNPTGNCLSSESIFKLLEYTREKCLVVIDEAYFEFSSNPSWAVQISKYNHLVVLKTLSKAYGLAGLRVGVAVCSAEILQILKKVLAPYPLSGLVVHEVMENSFSRAPIQKIIHQRDFLNEKLTQLKMFSKIYPSQTNFILCQLSETFSQGTSSTELVSLLQEQGFVIRDRHSDIQNCVRITVGTAAQNQSLLERLGTL